MIVTNYATNDLLVSDKAVQDDVLTPSSTATYPRGLLLARNTTTNKFVPWVSGGANGAGTPVALLGATISAVSAVDQTVPVIIGGLVRLKKCAVLAGGFADALTAQLKDVLRTYGIVGVSETELNIADNS